MLSWLFLLFLLPLLNAQETVLGVYIFHRHGDRTSKSWPPTHLTDLGYKQVYDAGTFYRNRYISNTSTSKIYGINPDTVSLSQIAAEAPLDNVLQSSAQGWLQGLYPPVGTTHASEVLANGSTVSAPMDGYQIIPVNMVASAASGASSENSAWLQGSSGCENAIVSSNNYFYSADYLQTLNSTNAFYQSLLPVINTTFTATTDTYKNAYTIFDYIHVSEIHNASSSISSAALLTLDTLHQLQTRADQHEWNLGYNASDPVRAIQGATLASQILLSLNATIAASSKSNKLVAQFGAYGSFGSFYGLANLQSFSANFTGIVDYASAMVFELVTNSTVSATSYPATSDISVRFLAVNGSAGYNPLTAYPLFGQSETVIPWSTFVANMTSIGVGDQVSWCAACGNTTGICAATTSSLSPTGATTGSSGSGPGMSTAVAGVIGAMVTLAVILGLEALLLLVGGLRIAKKNRGSVTSPQRSTITPGGSSSNDKAA